MLEEKVKEKINDSIDEIRMKIECLCASIRHRVKGGGLGCEEYVCLQIRYELKNIEKLLEYEEEDGEHLKESCGVLN